MINYLALFDTQKEKELFQAVYERYSQQLCRLALHILGSNIQAEDMVHETFLIFARNMDKIDMPDSPRTWNYLATILRRLCFNAYKKQSAMRRSAAEIHPHHRNSDKSEKPWSRQRPP